MAPRWSNFIQRHQHKSAFGNTRQPPDSRRTFPAADLFVRVEKKVRRDQRLDAEVVQRIEREQRGIEIGRMNVIEQQPDPYAAIRTAISPRLATRSFFRAISPA